MKKFLGFDDFEQHEQYAKAYKKIVGDYIEKDGGFGAASVGEVFSVAMGTDDHEVNFQQTRDLITGILSLLTDPSISSRLSPHLHARSGPLLSNLLFLFEESDKMENALDLMALDHDFSKEWLGQIDEKYTRLYKEAGLKMPSINE